MSDFGGLFRREAALPTRVLVDLHRQPIDVAAAMAGSEGFVFLDSSANGGTEARYSVVAWAPYMTFVSKGDAIEVRAGTRVWRVRANPLDVLDGLLRDARDAVAPRATTPLATGGSIPSTAGDAIAHTAGGSIPHTAGDSIPYAAGAIGYLGYDLCPHVERTLRLSAEDDLRLPDCRLGFYDTMLVFDHATSEWHATGATVFRGREDLDALIEGRMGELHRALAARSRAGGAQAGDARADLAPTVPESNFTRAAYLATVERAIEYIRAGDVYQVNVSQRFRARAAASPFALFDTLRHINPSAYGAFLTYPEHAVISASPELFLRRAGALVETQPIKGTRPRGADPAEDDLLRRSLIESEKDRAELSMIVDLMRNDLGRVCAYGSVEVVDHRRIEALPTVFHTVSKVRGMLRDHTSTVDMIRAAFPGGSISGCPKLRAVEIIDELEPTRRNAYTGAIGYLGFDGDVRLNLAIRTMIAKGHEVFYQVGGGIVADSDPEAEYDETLDKGAAMQRAIELAGRGDVS